MPGIVNSLKLGIKIKYQPANQIQTPQIGSILVADQIE